MKIEWNKVTWYSKAVALALFVALPFAAFWLGMDYGSLSAKTDVILESGTASMSATQPDAATYYANTAEWQTDDRTDAGFSIAFPLDFPVDDNYPATPSADWRMNASGVSGIKFLTLTIPSAFEPQTNFADATLTVGASGNDAAVSDCLTPDPSGGPDQASSTAMINAGTFTVFHSNNAGAGNLYETTSYRTIHDGQCYAIEYTIHASQIANYPASYDLQPFDETMVTGILDRVVGTFKFK